MHSHYSNKHSSAEVVPAQVDEADGLLELVRVWTDPEARRQGSASCLINDICHDADVEGKVIMLRPLPFGRASAMDLTRWYKGFGFTVIQKLPVLMARMPMPYKAKLHPVAGAAVEVCRA